MIALALVIAVLAALVFFGLRNPSWFVTARYDFLRNGVQLNGTFLPLEFPVLESEFVPPGQAYIFNPAAFSLSFDFEWPADSDMLYRFFFPNVAVLNPKDIVKITSVV